MKKVLSIDKLISAVLVMVMTFSLVIAGTGIGSIIVKADGLVSANIVYTAQYDGAFRGVKVGTDIASDTAENMGYEDSISANDKVSLLDVWVQIHKDLYPDYNINNKDEYFAVTSSEWGMTIVTAFHSQSMSVGYNKNYSESFGLNDTVSDGDVVDVFNYQDENFRDLYTRFADMTREDGYLSGTVIASGWSDGEYETMPLINAQLGWLDVDTLELIPASPFYTVTTDEAGQFSVEMPSTSKSYMLTIYDDEYNTRPLNRTIYTGVNTAPGVETTVKSTEEKKNIYESTGKYLSDANKSIVYGDNKEGILLGLGRANYPVNDGLYSGYYDSVKKYLTDNNGVFDSMTECAKVVTVLNVIGYDPTNVDGRDITKQLDDSDSVSGVYANAYVLIALDTKGYDSPARDTYLSNILNAQLDSGAWGWNNKSADIDTTGMVLAALAPYYNSDSNVTNAVDKALDYLSKAQAPSGAFASGMNENANTTAMVLLGLSELGIDVDTDSRFIKNGISVVDALCAFYVDGGGFGWTDNEVVNDLATYQSYYALVSYFRHINGMNRLFDMTPEKNSNNKVATTKVAAVPKTGDKWAVLCYNIR